MSSCLLSKEAFSLKLWRAENWIIWNLPCYAIKLYHIHTELSGCIDCGAFHLLSEVIKETNNEMDPGMQGASSNVPLLFEVWLIKGHISSPFIHFNSNALLCLRIWYRASGCCLQKCGSNKSVSLLNIKFKGKNIHTNNCYDSGPRFTESAESSLIQMQICREEAFKHLFRIESEWSSTAVHSCINWR